MELICGGLLVFGLPVGLLNFDKV